VTGFDTLENVTQGDVARYTKSVTQGDNVIKLQSDIEKLLFITRPVKWRAGSPRKQNGTLRKSAIQFAIQEKQLKKHY